MVCVVLHVSLPELIFVYVAHRFRISRILGKAIDSTRDFHMRISSFSGLSIVWKGWYPASTFLPNASLVYYCSF